MSYKPPVNRNPRGADPLPSAPEANYLDLSVGLFERVGWFGVITLPVLGLLYWGIYRFENAELSAYERCRRRDYPEGDAVAEAAHRASFHDSQRTWHQDLQCSAKKKDKACTRYVYSGVGIGTHDSSVGSIKLGRLWSEMLQFSLFGNGLLSLPSICVKSVDLAQCSETEFALTVKYLYKQ
ncbi:unnamed protein product [Penicillium pancosmium]